MKKKALIWTDRARPGSRRLPNDPPFAIRQLRRVCARRVSRRRDGAPQVAFSARSRKTRRAAAAARPRSRGAKRRGSTGRCYWSAAGAASRRHRMARPSSAFLVPTAAASTARCSISNTSASSCSNSICSTTAAPMKITFATGKAKRREARKDLAAIQITAGTSGLHRGRRRVARRSAAASSFAFAR